MSISLPLAQMTVEEKLQVMGAIWDDISQHAEELKPPAWHGNVLEAVESAIESGEGGFDDWENAKQRIRNDLP